jgi:magnesium chelatase subunit H
VLRGLTKVQPPVDYPEVGVYHSRMPGRFAHEAESLPQPPLGSEGGTVGVLLLRSYLLSNNAGHYDGVIAALEARAQQLAQGRFPLAQVFGQAKTQV